MSVCSVDGCENPHLARGWCGAHYSRWQTHGDVQADKPLRRSPDPDAVCSISGCERPHEARGWCNAHYNRWRKHGDPKPDKPIRQRYGPDDVCSVWGCDREIRRNGWCNAHSHRVQLCGDPQAHIPIGNGNGGREEGEPCNVCGGVEQRSDGRCAPCANRRRKEWEERNPEKVKELRRKKQVEQYGLSIEEYRTILTDQCGVCYICGEENGDRSLVVDHCHEHGHVRGLLCTTCNAALGMFGDDVTTLRKARQYLEDDGKHVEQILESSR